ncbi:DUF3267 domain-containing protein [Bacillus sp. 03113]|uniref:DUF3267 domain-containing protein n=1 Tax=Bacillus sp. 03113 TaxID=2578211 RepID=UPI001143A8AE|nr:DUF3267 domain-containing protein [Bacillus sp. 03113]
MNCWKTINFNKQYGSQRLVMLSSLTMLIAFIVLYVPATFLFVTTSLYNQYFLLFLLCLWLLYPIHKLLHYIPIAHLGKNVKRIVYFKLRFFPIIEIRAVEPISKHLFLLSSMLPFFLINVTLIIGCFLFTHYVHYLTILLAMHIGLCVPDFIRTKNVLFAPRKAYIEENEEGFEILVYTAD